VESRLKSCIYTTKDGQTRSSLEVTVSDVYFLGGKGADGHHSVKEVAQTVSIDDHPLEEAIINYFFVRENTLLGPRKGIAFRQAQDRL
jgi:single-stranded DNA-binding protein